MGNITNLPSIWAQWQQSQRQAAAMAEKRTEEEARAAWFAERDEILARWRHWGHYGRRPPDWWRFEAQRAYPGWDREAAALFEMGELRPDELALLMTEWRSYFDKVQSPDWVGMCVGQSEAGEAIWLTGKKGRQRWYEWAGIPLEVIEGFNAERIAR